MLKKNMDIEFFFEKYNSTFKDLIKIDNEGYKQKNLKVTY
jgi:hypothetical protein